MITPTDTNNDSSAATKAQYNPARALRAAMATGDTAGIVEAINKGAAVPNSEAFLKMAAQIPALASLPAVAAAMVINEAKQKAEAEVVPPAPQPEATSKTPTAQAKPATVTTSAAKPAKPATAQKGNAAMNAALNAAKQTLHKTSGVSPAKQQAELPVSGGLKKVEDPNKTNSR